MNEPTTESVPLADDSSTSQHEEAPSSSRCQLERRWVLFWFAFGCTSLVSGVVYGWPALRRQLQEDGSTLTEAQLGVVYTVGSWSTQGGRFFTGLARDRWGTRGVGCFSLACTLAGAIGIAFSDPNSAASLATSLFCISLGAGVQLVVQPVGILFPQTSNAIISSLSGSFQISGLVFLTLYSLPLSRRQGYLGYAGVVAILIGMAWVSLPKGTSFLPKSDDDHSKSLANETEEAEKEQVTEHPSSHSDLEKQVQQDDRDRQLSNLQQFISAEYVGLLIWFSIMLVPMQYYVGSIGFQLEQKGDEDGFYSNLFSIVYAASAVVGPPGGYLADQCGLGLTQAVSTVLVALSFYILGSHWRLEAQAAGMVCYSIGRMLVFGMFFSNVGRRFGYTNFGSLSGVGLLVTAIASILQYPLIAAASDNVGTARIVNFTSGTVLLALIPYCAWLAVTERRVDSARSWLTT